jgi:hypothetical protein
MKKFTVADGYAVMILVGQRMGINSSVLDVSRAQRQLEGKPVHVMFASSLEAAAIQINDRLRHSPDLVAQANRHAERVMSEYGFATDAYIGAEHSRQDEIQAQLRARGLRMEPSLSALDGEGHAVIDISTGEQADPERLTPEVIKLAEEWSLIEGVADREPAADLQRNV